MRSKTSLDACFDRKSDFHSFLAVQTGSAHSPFTRVIIKDVIYVRSPDCAQIAKIHHPGKFEAAREAQQVCRGVVALSA
ncbi:uncharacterized protein N7483_009648 [Penicillium malachiteum]|uniref:uncharacterized protein n=1 Tax=Penicillium malachiteum TaxID=1324776 RepID=UPI00254795FE|nr:uncharacterized protein N7483_009648 [Penicillium malachiteum]KAJ5721714.1 hypothetical protein N7483_009648 [Penicillium malachiteum]